MSSREWVLHKLGQRSDFLQKCGRSKDEVKIKWTIICFYRSAGKSTPYIARLLMCDHTSVLHALRNADSDIREKALELLIRYNEEVGKLGSITPLPKRPKKLGYIKVPDYKHSCVITKAIEL